MLKRIGSIAVALFALTATHGAASAAEYITGDARNGGKLSDVVTMTVFIRNQPDGNEFVKIRGEVFKKDFPASALITAKDFAVPQLLVEIQAVAVVGAK